MSTQPVPTFPSGYEHLVDKSAADIVEYILSDSNAMKNYKESFFTSFAESIITSDAEVVAKVSDFDIINEIWDMAKSQSDFVYAGKIFYVSSFLA